MSRPAWMQWARRRAFGLWYGSARAETPLYEEEPYDQITLDAANDNKC